jgi:branched-chain amino acid transport system permease protein
MSSRKFAKPFLIAGGVLLVLILPAFMGEPYTLHILIMAALNILLTSSLRIIALTGQLSLAHGGMMAVGAYTYSLMVMKIGICSWVAMPLAGLAAACLALLVGFPFVRIKGIYFAMVTVFLAEMITLTAEQWRSVTGGSSGIFSIPRPEALVISGLLNLDFSSKVDFYYLIIALLVISLVILYAVEHSRIGLTFLSIQQSDALAESVGVNTDRYKVLAFCLGCFFAGMAGAFYSQYIRAISPRTFNFFFTIYLVVYMIVGGGKKFAGPVVGAFIFTALPELFRWLKEFQPFVFASALMAVIFFLPEGLICLPERLVALYRARRNHA